MTIKTGLLACGLCLAVAGCGQDSSGTSTGATDTTITGATTTVAASAAPKPGPPFSPQIKARWVLERDDDSISSNSDESVTDYLEMTAEAAVQRTTEDGLSDSFAGFQLACGQPDEDAPMTAMRFTYKVNDAPDLTLDPNLWILLPGKWGTNGTVVDVAIAVDDEVPRCSGTYPANPTINGDEALDLSGRLPFASGKPLTVRLLLVARNYRTANYPDGQPLLWSKAKISQDPVPSVVGGEELSMQLSCYDGSRRWPYLGDVQYKPLLPLMPVGDPSDYEEADNPVPWRRDFSDQPAC